MAATYVTAAELKANLGIGTLYADSIVEEVCQTAEDMLNSYLWFDSYPVVGATLQSNVATVVISSAASFTTGQSITFTNCGATYNGTYTITGTYPWTTGSSAFPIIWNWPYSAFTFPKGYSLVQFAKTAADVNYKLIVPYGKAAGVDTKQTGYASTPAIREAAMIMACDIWQARQSSQNGGMTIDGAPSPWRMSSSLIAKIRGLIAPYESPRSMVG
jgi:hypothetical protein